MEGCTVLSLCELGDRLILEETGRVYKKEKEMKKGAVFFETLAVSRCLSSLRDLPVDKMLALKLTSYIVPQPFTDCALIRCM